MVKIKREALHKLYPKLYEDEEGVRVYAKDKREAFHKLYPFSAYRGKISKNIREVI